MTYRKPSFLIPGFTEQREVLMTAGANKRWESLNAGQRRSKEKVAEILNSWQAQLGVDTLVGTEVLLDPVKGKEGWFEVLEIDKEGRIWVEGLTGHYNIRVAQQFRIKK